MRPISILAWIALLAIAGVFCHAGISKALEPAEFARAIELYRVFPRAICVATALYLPWLEILCSLGLLWRKTRSGSLVLMAGMSGVFVAMILSAIVRGLDISCGCFGSGATDATGDLWFSLIRAALLLIASCVLLGREKRQFPTVSAAKLSK